MIIIGFGMFLMMILVDVFIHVAIQLYFEGHPAFNDTAVDVLEGR